MSKDTSREGQIQSLLLLGSWKKLHNKNHDNLTACSAFLG